MILTKAIIKELPKEGSNIYQVEIPLMEDNTRQEAIFEALLCSPPGIYGGYKVGDVVFVDFEDDRYTTAVIQGKLFTKVENDSSTYGVFNNLKALGTATLSDSAKLGDYDSNDIFTIYQTTGGGSLRYEVIREW